MNNSFDVIISGAGPSGSLAGYLLALKGINTLILEKSNFPRHKICAGGLQYRTYKLLPFDIKETIEKKIYGIYFSFKSKGIFHKKYQEPIIITTRRSNFDNFLALKAKNAGCKINFNCKVLDFNIGKESIEVKTNKGKFYSKVLVGADGVRGTLYSKIMPKREIRKIIGYEFEIDIDKTNACIDLSENLSLDFGGAKKSYTWIFPKEKSFSCGTGGPMENSEKIRNYFKYFTSKYCLFENNVNKKRIYAQTIPVRVKDGPISDYRVMSIGDAAGLGDALTGEGLYNGFKSSFIAADSIADAFKSGDFSFNRYWDKLNEEVYSNIRLSFKFSNFLFAFPSFIYKTIKKSDRAFNMCCQILRGEKTYKDIAKKLKFF